jgi:DNA-binding transcriptional LysR family regulator
MLTLQQLKYFTVLSETLHYTKAAEILHISQPTLSYAIAELQKELGVPLIEKRKKILALTQYGEAFLTYAKSSLMAVAEGQKVMKEMRGKAEGTIRLGYIYSIGFDIIPHLVSSFQDQQGNGDISFSFYQGIKGQILENLKNATIDLAVASSPQSETIESTYLGEQQLYLAVPKNHPMVGQGPVTLSALRDCPFIIAQKLSGLRTFTDSAFLAAGISPEIAYEVEECNAMLAFVSAGQGVTIVPKVPALEIYDVALLEVSSPRFFREINLLQVKKRKLSSAAARFREFVLSSDGLAFFGSRDVSTA